MFYQCHWCTETFSRRQYLQNHINYVHEGQERRPQFTQSLLHTIENNSNLPMINKNGIIRIVPHTAFGNCIRNIIFYSADDADLKLPHMFFEAAKDLIQETLEILKSDNCEINICSTLCVRFVKQTEMEQMDNAFFSINSIRLTDYDIDDVINSLLLKIDNYNSRGSNWKIQNTNFFRLYASHKK